MVAMLRSVGFVRVALALAVLLSAVQGGVAVAQEQAAAPVALTTMSFEDAVAAATVSDGVLRFDIAENAAQFAWDPDLTHEEDGMPAYGNSFIT